MAIWRQLDQDKGTVILTCKGNALTGELNINDPKQILESLTSVIENAYQKLRDAGID